MTSPLVRFSCAPALLALAGCAATPPDGASVQVQEDQPILWQKSGTYSRIARPARVLIRDAATLAQVPVAEIPVDFQTQMVLLSALGPTPTNDFGILIARVWQQGSRIRVQERQIHPGLTEKRGLEPASPWTMVVIPRSDLNVEGYPAVVPKGFLSDQPLRR